MRTFLLASLVWAIFSNLAFSQSLVLNHRDGISVESYRDPGNKLFPFAEAVPLFSVRINGDIAFSSEMKTSLSDGNSSEIKWEDLKITVVEDSSYRNGWKCEVTFENLSEDTLIIENVVPFGESEDRLFITGHGPWSLSRAYLFRPGESPVNIILPDDAWELGYGMEVLEEGLSVAALARRVKVENGKRHRYKTYLHPGGMLTYNIFGDEYSGSWQEGLIRLFRERWMYSLESFYNTLFERQDLQWIKRDYVIGLQMSWDKMFYNPLQGEYLINDFLEEGQKHFGGYDVYGIWPTWPRLGLDERNQWDLYEDLPGGLEKLKEISSGLHADGSKFFLCYNPWDQSTRYTDPYKGMATLIRATDADGVVLDTRGSSSFQLQRAADSVKEGVVMYSEGMAIVKDMPGIISGRVHNAIFLSPPLNINKLIKPDFAIFRVWDVQQAPLHREAAIAFFNGYGTELNFFGPGRPPRIEEEMTFLGKTTRILRENSTNFLSESWRPLVSSRVDSILVNYWPTEEKILYTILNLDPGGYEGAITPAPEGSWHFISLWNHEHVPFDTIAGVAYLHTRLAPFPGSWSGGRKEGSIDCIAAFKRHLQTELNNRILITGSGSGSQILIWAGDPSYQNTSMIQKGIERDTTDLLRQFSDYEGKIVVQLLDEEGLLMDEEVLYIEPGKPVLVSKKERTAGGQGIPSGMKLVKGGRYAFITDSQDQFIPYPGHGDTSNLVIEDFCMDTYPVTNARYFEFIEKSGYQPADTNNYLKHWQGSSYPDGQADHPVVYISREDALAYAKWAGKRLPTEQEWQYAAQGNDGRKYPWGDQVDSAKCNYSLGHSTAVGSYPEGKSPFGIMDMTGNVWQMTSDLYDNGSYYFVILKGGSFYEPTASWWYVSGGAKPVSRRQMWLQVSPGFDRSSTVGFRCVSDL